MFAVYRQLAQLNDTQFNDSELLKLNPFVWELGFWLLVGALTVLFLYWRPRWMDQFEGAFVRFSRRKVLAVVSVGLLVVTLRVATLPWNPEPVPAIHDEFSYLLQAETFKHGRLTNPTHPLWVHFESFHINMWPTYQSMYPVGQASFLLVGHLLSGDPWIGVIFSVALMCSVLLWALQGWMPPQWALFGALLVVGRFGVYGSWINSFWGGAVAAIGGCLVLGAMARLRHRRNVVRNALWFAVGLAILANTRPFEGFIFSLVPLGWAAVWLVRELRSTPANAYKAFACGAAVLLPVFLGMLYYNYRSTGNPLLLPYAINHRTYHISKPFLWQERYDFPQYNHFIMKKFYIFHELPDYMNARQPGGLVKMTFKKIAFYYEFFLWPLAIAFIPAAWFAVKSRRWRLPFFALLAVFLALLVQMWPAHGHYAAPATAVIVAFVVLIFRLARTVKFREMPLGIAFSRAALVSLVIVGATWWVGSAVNLEGISRFMVRIPPGVERVRIISELERTPEKHLIIVQYPYYAWPGVDWVYNSPDIDNAKIVWARDMGDRANRRLLEYYRDRKVWIINTGERRLRAYELIPANMDELAAAITRMQTATLRPHTAQEKKVHAE